MTKIDRSGFPKTVDELLGAGSARLHGLTPYEQVALSVSLWLLTIGHVPWFHVCLPHAGGSLFTGDVVGGCLYIPRKGHTNSTGCIFVGTGRTDRAGRTALTGL